VLASVSTLPHPARKIAVFRRADLPSEERPTGIALWRVGDPGNLGTILRTADALGPAFVALSEGCADPTGPKAVRGSMGAVFRVPLVPFDDAPGRRVALVAHGGEPLQELDLSGDITFVLGAEREGLPDELAASCDARATIPVEPGAESLNVAAAAALALYERRRR
jgi:TrmH family RNA methyltransferase